ncbi:MAG: hydroxymethylglutaryl-CoA lyase [Ectothiorhodospiraceae bacterium]|nr:hydroxymethylglutaryl-CoA lyase [Ectothiorhodospiraceae bacterium]
MSAVTVYEVGPRDGLQNESRIIPTVDKIRLVDLLSTTGLRHIEATSFVSPRWVPQMADAAEVMAGITRTAGVRYAALTPNLRGYERAREARVDEVAVFAAASETFSHKNINCSIADSIERFRPVLEAAAADGIPVRGYVSCVVACPYDGPVAPRAVATVVGQLLALGCHAVSLGDTIGAGTPATIDAMLDAVLAVAPASRLAGHYHDTGGRAIDNVLATLDRDITVFDAATGGLGGCPYAPGAKGNVATGPLVDALAARGVETGIDREQLRAAEVLVASLAVGDDARGTNQRGTT